jgi:hypothetical protein
MPVKKIKDILKLGFIIRGVINIIMNIIKIILIKAEKLYVCLSYII